MRDTERALVNRRGSVQRMTLIEIIRKRSECESKCLCIMFGSRGGEEGAGSRADCVSVRIDKSGLFSCLLLEVQRCPKMKSSCEVVQAAVLLFVLF